MVRLASLLLPLSLVSLVSARSPLGRRGNAPPASVPASFDVAHPGASIVSPITGRSGNVNSDDFLGDLLSEQSGGSNIGSTNRDGTTHSTISSGTILDTLSGANSHSNDLDTSILSLHSDSGTTGLSGQGTTSPVDLNQRSASMGDYGSDLLALLPNAGVDGTRAASILQTRKESRAERFRRRPGLKGRQATAGDVLSTLSGAAGALPNLPSPDSLPAASPPPDSGDEA